MTGSLVGEVLLAAALTMSALQIPQVPENASSSNESLLREVLAMASEPWARDFLFQTDPAADVCALTSPMQLQHGIGIDCLISLYESTQKYGGLFSMEFECRWLIVPAFSIDSTAACSRDSLTAEIVVQVHERFRSSRVFLITGVTTFVRMIRSNVTGDIVLSMMTRRIR